MNRLIIAMKNKHQSQKLAIVLSSSYESVIVDSCAKLKSLFLTNDDSGYETVIYEDDSKECNFTAEIEDLAKAKKISFQAIRITPQNSGIQSSDTFLVLEKPFGPIELIKSLGNINTKPANSSVASA